MWRAGCFTAAILLVLRECEPIAALYYELYYESWSMFIGPLLGTSCKFLQSVHNTTAGLLGQLNVCATFLTCTEVHEIAAQSLQHAYVNRFWIQMSPINSMLHALGQINPCTADESPAKYLCVMCMFSAFRLLRPCSWL